MSLKRVTFVPAERVWQSWVAAYAGDGRDLVEGSIGHKQDARGKKVPYRILAVSPGRRFSVSWKTVFTSLIFHYEVNSSRVGTEVQCDFAIRGPFAWLIYWMLSQKIRENLSSTLKAFVEKLEAH